MFSFNPCVIILLALSGGWLYTLAALSPSLILKLLLLISWFGDVVSSKANGLIGFIPTISELSKNALSGIIKILLSANADSIVLLFIKRTAGAFSNCPYNIGILLSLSPTNVFLPSYNVSSTLGSSLWNSSINLSSHYKVISELLCVIPVIFNEAIVIQSSKLSQDCVFI